MQVSLIMIISTHVHADLNECESNSTNTCHEAAECHDTEGSYRCECGPGFIGDGYNCTGLLTTRMCYCTGCLPSFHSWLHSLQTISRVFW